MTFSEQFIQIMDEIFRRVGIIVDWTSQNVTPHLVDFAERFIQYEIFTNSLLVIGIIISFIFCLIMSMIGAKRDWELRLFGFCVATATLGFAGLVAIPSIAQEIIQAVFIPEMTIIEQLMTLIK